LTFLLTNLEKALGKLHAECSSSAYRFPLHNQLASSTS
jgi:hypothetical protein